jgi:hypothetical protein
MPRSAALVEEAVLRCPRSSATTRASARSREHIFGAGRASTTSSTSNGGASGIGGGLIVHGIPIGGSGGTPASSGRTGLGIAAHDTVARPAACSRSSAAVRGCSRSPVSPAADEPTLAAALAASRLAAVAPELARHAHPLDRPRNAVNVLNPSLVGARRASVATVAESDPDRVIAAAVAEQAMPAAAEGLDIRVAALSARTGCRSGPPSSPVSSGCLADPLLEG